MMYQVTCVFIVPGPQWLGPYMVIMKDFWTHTTNHTQVSKMGVVNRINEMVWSVGLVKWGCGQLVCL